MRTTLIQIKDLFGIIETELDGSSIELTGTNGTGKSSVVKAIRWALTNSSECDYIIRDGATEGEIYIEMDTGLRISRAKRTQKADYKSVKEGGREVQGPENFLKTLFTPLQLDPMAFTRMSKKEQNRAILDLIEFDWDLNWIREQFGEVPARVDYGQNILQVLNDIQAENGDYFQRRQEINREARTKRAIVDEIAKDIPQGYDVAKWESLDIGALYRELDRIKENNSIIERAKAFKTAHDNKLRGLEAEYEIDKAAQIKAIDGEREELTGLIFRLKAELAAAEDKMQTLETRKAEKQQLAEARYREKLAKLDNDTQIAAKYADAVPDDTSALQAEINEGEAMKRHLNEYTRMERMQGELDSLTAASDELTRKIELARDLPARILETATLPLDGLTVKDGVPLIHGLPISNLSEGEQLDLCVDVAMANPAALQIILIDGAEKLSDENRERLYNRCKKAGLQFIATRTTNENEMKVTVL